jgi:hypothetical protein
MPWSQPETVFRLKTRATLVIHIFAHDGLPAFFYEAAIPEAVLQKAVS